MGEPTPHTIDYGEGAPSVDAQMRKWAHCRLDRLLTEREILRETNPAIGPLFGLGNGGQIVGQSPDLANYFRAVLGFATQLIGADIREAVAPTYTAEGSDQRAALAAQLDLVQSVWPTRPKSVGSFFRQTLWTSDLSRALEMLDEGHVPPIFKHATGADKKNYAWHEKRFRALGALWATHLEAAQKENSFAANDLVAEAFGLSGSIYRRGGTIKRWRKDFAAGKLGVDAINAEIGIRIASDWIGPGHDAELLAKSLSHIAFGTRMDGAGSLAEAGERYRAHKAQINARQRAGLRAGVRSKKRKVHSA